LALYFLAKEYLHKRRAKNVDEIDFIVTFLLLLQQPLPPKKPPRRNVSVSPVRTHSSGSLLETSDYHHLLQASIFFKTVYILAKL